MVSQPPGDAISVVDEKSPSSKFLSDFILGVESSKEYVLFIVIAS